MLRGVTSFLRGLPGTLTEAQKQMYYLEREENFRWAAQLLAKPAPEPLHSSDLVDTSLQEEISAIGQFAEVAHGSISPEFIWEYLTHLSEQDYPLCLYRALEGSTLLDVFHGTVANLQGYIAYRPDAKQVVVAYSGTSSSAQALKAVQVHMVSHPCGGECRVHSGFWSMYAGIREVALSSFRKALEGHEVQEVVITGHSMGGVISSFFCLDVLGESNSESEGRNISLSDKVKLVIFGAPRFGNAAFAKHWRDAVDRHQVNEYSVRIYNDGVPQMPPYLLGYRHLSCCPLYFAYGRLWQISPAQSEYTLFKFDPKAIDNTIDSFPLGGHNYYNGCDMELLQRRIKWFHPLSKGELWETLKARFHEKLLEEQRANGH